MLMTPRETSQIEMAIASVERQTRGQIVLLVAQSSHFYGWVHAAWAAGGWLVGALGTVLAVSLGHRLTLPQAIVLQVFAANLAALVSFLPALKRATIPRRLRNQAVLTTARANFFASRAEGEPNGLSIYVFLSFFERRAELDADPLIRAKAPLDFWQAESDALSAALKTEDWLVVLLRVIAKLGDRFEEAAPLPAEVIDEEEPPPPPSRLFN
jgi:uncharacterized membrane protein